jgi:hypothetical protein
LDLHQALSILAPGSDGRIDLRDPVLAFHAEPLTEFEVASGSFAGASSTLDLRISPEAMKEIPVPAWSAALLWGVDGFCLSGTDGDAPEVHAGAACLYLRRNRPSRIDLVAGPEGFRGRLFLGESSPR